MLAYYPLQEVIEGMVLGCIQSQYEDLGHLVALSGAGQDFCLKNC